MSLVKRAYFHKPSIRESVRAAYRPGRSLRQIASQVGISHKTVGRILDRLGLPRKTKPYRPMKSNPADWGYEGTAINQW